MRKVTPLFDMSYFTPGLLRMNPVTLFAARRARVVVRARGAPEPVKFPVHDAGRRIYGGGSYSALICLIRSLIQYQNRYPPANRHQFPSKSYQDQNGPSP